MSHHTLSTQHPSDPLKYEEEDVDPHLQVLMVLTEISSSSPVKTVTPSSPPPRVNQRQHQELLQNIANDLEVSLEDVQDHNTDS